MTAIKRLKHNKRFVKISKIVLALILVLLGFMLLVPAVFSDEITAIIKKQANESLITNLEFASTDVSFFKHFPALTVSFYELSLMESEPFNTEHLVSAEEIYFKINILKLIFNNQIKVKAIAIENANINLKIDKIGSANYNVYKIATDTATQQTNKDIFFEIDQFKINNSELSFNDTSSNIEINASNLSFSGDGAILQTDVYLNSNIRADSFIFKYDDVNYFEDKEINAKVQTKYNTDELTFKFEKNKININKLPLFFGGEISILKDAFYLDFEVNIDNTGLDKVLSAFPPKYMAWKQKTKIKGKTNAIINLKGTKNSLQNISPDLSLVLQIENGQINHQYTEELIENFNIDLKLFMPQLNPTGMDINLNNFEFNLEDRYLKGFYKANHDQNGLLVKSNIDGLLDLQNLSSALGVENLELNGLLAISLQSDGYLNSQSSQFPKSIGFLKVENATLKSPYYPNPITNINTDIKIDNAEDIYSSASLLIENLSFMFEGEPFNAKASFVNFDNPAYNITANGRFNLNKIYQVLGSQKNTLDGYIDANVQLIGKQSDVQEGNYSNIYHTGKLKFENISTRMASFPKVVLLKDGLFQFTNNTTTFDDFKAKYGDSDVTLNGDFNNLVNYFLSNNTALNGTIVLESEFLNLNDFIPSFAYKNSEAYNPIYQDTNSVQEYGVFKVPERVNLSTEILASKISYDSIDIYDLKALVEVSNNNLNIKSSSLKLIDSKAEITGTYTTLSDTKALFNYSFNIENFDIKRAYNELKLFRTLAPASEYADGITSLNYKISGILDGNMTPILPSLEGEGVLSIKQVRLKGYKLLSTVSKSTNNDAFESPDLREIDISTRIKDNILTIERFRIKSRGFRLRNEGEASLDGDLNLKMRLGLPPFGIIGIPLKVTGNSDEPKIQLGRKSEDLEAISYEDYLELQQDSTNLKSMDSLKINQLRNKFEKSHLLTVPTINDSTNLEQFIINNKLIDSLDFRKNDTIQQKN